MPLRQLLLLIFVISRVATASLPPLREKADSWLNSLGANGKFDPGKGLDWGIIPGPFYTPELGVGIGAALAGLYRPARADQQSQNSSLTISGYGSSTGAFGLALENHTFLSGDRWRIFVTGSVSNTPAYYWGKGYHAGHNNHNRQIYTARTLTLNPQLMYRLIAHTYLTLDWSVSQFHAAKIHPGNNVLTQHLPASVFSSAPGIGISYDSRDSVNYPSRGVSATLHYRYYSPATGSDHPFNDMRTSVSLYHSVKAKSVLAWETRVRLTRGQVPWNQLPSLGDSMHMRGYYQGRYRDATQISSQIELRQKLSWRHGVVLWAGMGTLSDKISRLGSGHWLPTTGIGYRFEIKPDINIRLDYGIGKASSGFYFQLGEAF